MNRFLVHTIVILIFFCVLLIVSVKLLHPSTTITNIDNKEIAITYRQLDGFKTMLLEPLEEVTFTLDSEYSFAVYASLEKDHNFDCAINNNGRYDIKSYTEYLCCDTESDSCDYATSLFSYPKIKISYSVDKGLAVKEMD